jgi:hypothetical protein
MTRIPKIDSGFWTAIENPDPDDDAPDQPLQHLLTTFLNAAEITAISTLLRPWPAFQHAFMARTDKNQKHVSWTFNPKTRGFYGIAMLPDAEFSRAIALALFHPIISPCTCPCGKPIDPVGFHLLHCKRTHYGCLHDRVKHAVACRIRSFMTAEAASFSVLIEQPMLKHFGLRDATQPEGTAGVADLILSMHADLQQEPTAVDFVSCFAAGNRDYDTVFGATARFKRRKYYKYNTLTDDGFFPLPFSRTNALSDDVTRFCSMIGKHLPPHMRARDKLVATFSRAIYSGVAQTFNLSFRRLQLVACSGRPFLASDSLLHPYVFEPRSRAALAVSRRPPFAPVPLVEALAAALASSPSGDVARVLAVKGRQGMDAGGG